MKDIIVKVNFSTGKETFIKGDKLNNLSYNQIVKLNEKGFIEPLTYEDLIMIKRELNKKKEEL